jgi:hypothetical protein
MDRRTKHAVEQAAADAKQIGENLTFDDVLAKVGYRGRQSRRLGRELPHG